MAVVLFINVGFSFPVWIADTLMQAYTQYLMKASHTVRA